MTLCRRVTSRTRGVSAAAGICAAGAAAPSPGAAAAGGCGSCTVGFCAAGGWPAGYWSTGYWPSGYWAAGSWITGRWTMGTWSTVTWARSSAAMASRDTRRRFIARSSERPRGPDQRVEELAQGPLGDRARAGALADDGDARVGDLRAADAVVAADVERAHDATDAQRLDLVVDAHRALAGDDEVAVGLHVDDDHGDAGAHVRVAVLLRIAGEVRVLRDLDARQHAVPERAVVERVGVEARGQRRVVLALGLVLVLDAVRLLDRHGQQVADAARAQVGDRGEARAGAHVRVLGRGAGRRGGEQG